MTNLGQTGIIPFSNFGNKFEGPTGSSYLRAFSIVDNAQDFHIWTQGSKYDNLIFQKVYWKEMKTLFEGPKILDICDPDWVQGTVNIIEIGKLADAITCSSEGLTTLTKKYFSNKLVVHVPDRLNFKAFPKPRGSHSDVATKAVWFGYIHNAEETLGQLLPTIRKHKLKLTIIADNEIERAKQALKGIDFEFIKYDQQTVYFQLKQADIVLNPRSERAFYKYKSNNKSIISWKLGLPVAIDIAELEKYLNPDNRNIEVIQKAKLVEQEYNIHKSIDQYREILSIIRKSK